MQVRAQRARASVRDAASLPTMAGLKVPGPRSEPWGVHNWQRLFPIAASRKISLLTPEQAARATENCGSDIRLDQVRSKLLRGDNVTIAALGGSVSAASHGMSGMRANIPWSFHSQLAHALRLWRPSRHSSSKSIVVHHNGAIPATGPAFFEHCLRAQMPAGRTDLVLVEFAVNMATEPAAAFERLLRQLLRMHSPPPAVVVVNVHHWQRSCPRGAPYTFRNPHCRWRDLQSWNASTAEEAIAALCRHYDVPLVSMRAALFANGSALTAQGETLLTAAAYMGKEEGKKDSKIHPGPVGHTHLAQYVVSRVLCATPAARHCCEQQHRAHSQAAWTTHGHKAADAEDAWHLPLPLLRHGREFARGASICARGPALGALVSSPTSGFAYTEEGRAKPGLVAHAAGSVLTFDLGNESDACTDMHPPQYSRRRQRPQAVQAVDQRELHWMGREEQKTQLTHAGAESCSFRTSVTLAHLLSYSPEMGRAQVRCFGQCQCQQVIVDARTHKRVSVTHLFPFEVQRNVSAHGEGGGCKLQLKVLPGRSSQSGCCKFKVIGLLVFPRAEGERRIQASHHSLLHVTNSSAQLELPF